jgi:putative transposase
LIKHKKGKLALARELGIAISSLYYKPTLPQKDWMLKVRIEEALRYHPSYGHRRLGLHLHVNKKRILRVMRIYDIKPYRRRGRKPKKREGISSQEYPNLLKKTAPSYPNHVWAADFTYIAYRGKFIYLATTVDLYTREVVGMSMSSRHDTALVLGALFEGIRHRPRPSIFHSDNGREYNSRVFTEALTDLGILISRSKKASPWENGYQESFYSQFKIELGDPDRFKTMGELVYEIHRLIYVYNTSRIHLALKMPPKIFAERHQKALESSY